MAGAADFPNRPVDIQVYAPKGGPSDIIAQIIIDKLEKKWKQPISVVVKVPMYKCFESLAKAPADGYTISMAGGGFFINCELYPNIPFNGRKDFAPVTMAASIANVMVVHPSLPVRSVKEFIDYAKANPGKLRYGTSGLAGPPHLAGELFRQATGVDIVPVHYQGHVPAGHALVKGEIDFFFDAIMTGKPHLDAGEVIPLAVTSAKRMPVLPDIPSLAELGVNFTINPDMGVIAPAGTPQDIVDKISADMCEVLHMPEVGAKLESLGMVARGTTPKEFGAYMEQAFGKWGQVLKNAGIESRPMKF